MRNAPLGLLAAALLVSLATVPGAGIDDAAAQKIVCWKDKSGKTIGCGDKVPPEYADSAIKELDKRGITRKTQDSADEIARAKAREEEADKRKEEEKKRLAEQRRRDAALLNTFSNEKEIDLKRDREVLALDTQLTQTRVAQKNLVERLRDVNSRIEITTKSGKPPTETQKEDLSRAESDLAKSTQMIAAREKEIVEIRKRYAEMKQRYTQLRGGGGAPGAGAAAAPTKK